VEIVEMDDEELYVPGDVLGEASGKCCLKNQNYVIKKNWKNLWVNQNQRVKDNERKMMSESEVNERETNLDLLVNMDTNSLSREVSNKFKL
jgi:hypothetical protein